VVRPPWLAAAGAAGTAEDPGLQTGLRRLHVSAVLAPPLDGSTPDAVFRTLQEAMDTARPGDVVTVAAGVYRERPLLRNVAASASLPLWIVAEQRGAVLISDTWAEAEAGRVAWIDAGDGVFHADCAARPYIGEHDGDFLMAYLSEDDLRAPAITTYSAISRTEIEVAKPDYGFAFVADEGRVYLKLRGGLDPNGRAVRLTGSFGRPTLTVRRSSHVILDGFVFEGAGNSQALAFDDDCDHATVRNCVFWLARHGVRCPSNTIIETCTYRYVGFDRWTRDLFQLDGAADNGVFALIKGYYHAAAVGAGRRGNGLLEGSLDFGYDFPEAQRNILIDRCLIGPCFDGARIGEFVESEISHTVFLECRDDGFQNEGPKGKPSRDNRIHDCRFVDCFHDTSHQGGDIDGNAFVYRNLFEWTDPGLAIPDNFSIKAIATPKAADVYYYHNTWVIDYGASQGGALRVWADFGGANSTAGEIEAFVNNVVVIPHDLVDGSGPNPRIIASNAVVAASPAAAGFLTANGGVFAGADSADMRLNPDRSLRADSPARALGQRLPTLLPDSRTGPDAYRDAGAFPFGERPGADWPRPRRIVFDQRPPGRWTSPGLSR
jgi:hypothetical protein